MATLVNSQANLAGTYATTSSFEVLGILEDSFTRTEFKVTVGTENYVYTYDKNGIGIGKARERGALDVKGDIYANDMPIQQHQLTTNNGFSMSVSTDIDELNEVGMYYLINALNSPDGRDGYIFVENHSSNRNWVKQTYTDYSGRTILYRTKNNGTWQPWKTLVTDDHANLVNTGWVGTGVDGVTAKRVGDIVHVNINGISLSKTTEYHLGTLPENMRPNFSLMLDLAVWVVNDESVKLQLSSDGGMVVLAQSVVNSRTLSTQFSFAI